MQNNTVLYNKTDNVATITLNRPEAYNTINADLASMLLKYLSEAYTDDSVYAIVLTGAGEKAFCAGLDLKALTVNPDILQSDAELAHLLQNRNKPMIGAINGYAITGGLEVALACDILYASDNAVFSDTHCKVGIMPTWGMSQRLPRLIGYGRAKEMSFSGRKINAQTALNWGLVNRVFPQAQLLAEAEKLAKEIAANNYKHIQNLKGIIDGGNGKSVQDALAYERSVSMEENKKIDFGQMINRLNEMKKA